MQPTLLILLASIAAPPEPKAIDPAVAMAWANNTDSRVSELEARVRRLESMLGVPAPVVARVASSVVVPPGMHAHTKADGTVIIHGDENFGNAAAHAGISHPWPKTAVAGQVVQTTATAPVAATSRYTSSYSQTTSSCPAGGCPPQSSGRWEPFGGVFRR